MATVILGSGIIGVSAAFYLLDSQPGSSIHLVDPAAELFTSASGYAAGFLAKDWHRPSAASLGALSFAEHARLAREEGGREKWGYASTVSLSYRPATGSRDGKKGEDWLLEGTSRATAVDARGENPGGAAEVPDWLRRAAGDDVGVLDDGRGTAIVDPLRLCGFLLRRCRDAGVHLHHPANALSVCTDDNGQLTGVRIGYSDGSSEVQVAATRILLAAGAWTPALFSRLFPAATVSIPVSSLAGHSLVVRTPAWSVDAQRSHAVFCALEGYSPEIFSRPNGLIYIAGLNSATAPLPSAEGGAAPPVASDVQTLMDAVREFVRDDAAGVEVVRAGLCFRPVSQRGTPIVARLTGEQLGVRGDVYVACGHGPWGISLSLGTGRVVADLMHGREPSADITGLGL